MELFSALFSHFKCFSLKRDKGPNIVGGDSDPAPTEYSIRSTKPEMSPLGHISSAPPSQSSSNKHIPSDYSPHSGLPPSHSQPSSLNPPPYHDWTSIPDTALLPPPPSISYVNSPANNASYNDAARAHAWCNQNPPYTPSTPSPAIRDAIQHSDIAFELPQEYTGTLKQPSNSTGKWHGKSKPSSPDSVLLSSLPLYIARLDSPLRAECSKTIYFELRVLHVGGADSGIAIGYCAKPYPSWRQPGWHRASLGIHGDDGRRFVNDSWGGVDFVQKFNEGDVVGVGMNFQLPDVGDVLGPGGKVITEAFFTRNGVWEGGWVIDEERDAERDEGVEGLQGELDMYAAVGVFGGVEFEIMLGMEGWRYHIAGH
jgi:SPRY domain